jgi:hypothetical protein
MDANSRSRHAFLMQLARQSPLAVLLALSLAIAAIGCAGAQVYLLTGNDPNRPLDRSRPPVSRDSVI